MQAQDSRTLLNDFLLKMTGQPVELTFLFTYENLSQKIKESQEGVVVYDGRLFRLYAGDMEVYSDGKSKWIYNKLVDEVTIFPAGDTHDVTDNPLEYILQNKDDFRYKPTMQRKAVADKYLLSIDLLPQDKKVAYLSIGLAIEESTLEPVEIQYRMKDGQRYTVKIMKINFKPDVKATDFIFPVILYPNAEVIDLRDLS
jgi:outer membrane lipoprotein-sorting protein